MKTIIIIFFIFLGFNGFSQEFTYFNTYNIHEFFNKEKLKWQQVESGSASNHLVWNVFFEKKQGIIMFQDSATGDFFHYKILGLEIKNDIYTYRSERMSSMSSNDVYILFYKEEGYIVVKIEDPTIYIRFKRKL